MPTEEIRLTNQDTGETAIWLADRGAPRVREKLDDRFILLFDQGLDMLMWSSLTVTEFRVFLLLLKRAKSEAWHVDTTKLGPLLGIDTRRVSRALAHLAGVDLIRRPERGMVELNPHVAWRGSTAKRNAAIREEPDGDA